MTKAKNIKVKDVDYMTLQEVAEKTKVSTRTLRRYIQDGKIKAVMFGRRWKIADMELQRVLQAG